MSSKETRNAIIALFVLAAGIKIIQTIAGNYIPDVEVSGLDNVVAGLNDLSDLIVLGVVALAIILIPVYVYQHYKKNGSK